MWTDGWTDGSRNTSRIFFLFISVSYFYKGERKILRRTEMDCAITAFGILPVASREAQEVEVGAGAKVGTIE